VIPAIVLLTGAPGGAAATPVDGLVDGFVEHPAVAHDADARTALDAAAAADRGPAARGTDTGTGPGIGGEPGDEPGRTLDPAASEGASATVVPIAPSRLYDSREPPGGVPRRVGGAEVVEVAVAGSAGIPTSGVAAVALNVTVTEPLDAGHLTVYPCGPVPATSNLNYLAGQTVANAVLTSVSASGSVCLVSVAATHVVVDVSGWLPADGSFRATAPSRVLDTRDGTGAARAAVGTNASLRLQLTGRGGIPTGGVRAVALNLTAVGPDRDGFLTLYPCGSVPTASNVNFRAGHTVPNSVIAPLDANGGTCVYSHATTDIVADVSGWFSTAPGFTASEPTRLLDTRRRGDGRELCYRLSASDPIGDVSALDVAGYAAQNDCGWWTFAAVAPAAFDNASMAYFAVQFDLDLDQATGCDGLDAVALGGLNTAQALVGGLFSTPSCDQRSWTTLGQAIAARPTDNGIALSFEDRLLGAYPSLRWRVQLVARNGTRVDNAPDLGAHTYRRAPGFKQAADSVHELVVAGRAGLPASGVAAVALTVTATEADGAGFVTVHGCGARPNASNLNFVALQTVPNLVLAPVSPDGKVCLYTSQQVHLVADLTGWFAT